MSNFVPYSFIPYGRQWVEDDDISSVVGVLKSDYLTQGPRVKEFEDAICKYTNAKYCVAVASGTAALHLAVASLNIEINSEGITSPNTFTASSNSLVYNHILPVFADIDKQTYNIDVNEIKQKLTDKTKVIIPVHFSGQPCKMKEISHLAKSNNIFVIEDAAHAIGSKYSDGKNVGNCKYSDLTIFSFHPVKTMTTGEGGAITTNDCKLYERLLLLRSHGITKDFSKYIPYNKEYKNCPWYYEMLELGYNYRLTDIQAALGISQLSKLDSFIKRRRTIVERYNNAFKDVGWLTTPKQSNNVYSAYHLYVLLIDFEKINKSRQQVMNLLREQKIGTQVHYIPVHTQPYYQKTFNYKFGDLPKVEAYYKKALSIPLYPKMSDDEVSYVIENILKLEY